jgi:hypothetical protein
MKEETHKKRRGKMVTLVAECVDVEGWWQEGKKGR